MSISLDEILGLVGPLDDSPGDETARERFRRFLRNNVKEVGQIRDYVEGCLRNSGDQYNRALQDLVNYVGEFLGFQVTFGRYRGVQGQVGFDGHWKSPTGFHAVVEVKTTETYAIKAATLVGYVDELISEKKIPDWDSAIGLYVVGRPDPEVHQVENAILAEKRTHQLRIISVESLLSLAEMMSDYDVSHEDILAVLRPSGPTVDSVVDLMARLVAQRRTEETPKEPVETPEPSAENGAAYWLTPVKGDEEQTAEEVVGTLVGQEKIYAFGERTPGRKRLKPGDWICFYATAKGVIAHAKVTSSPEKKKHPRVRHPEKYPWTFRLDNTRLYLEEPVVIDGATRTRLEAFEGRDPDQSWAWFVQATRRIAERDFKTLTRHRAEH
jgi:hypothetical protein